MELSTSKPNNTKKTRFSNRLNRHGIVRYTCISVSFYEASQNPTLTKTLLSPTTAMASSLILLRRSLRSLSGLHHSFSATATSLSVPITGSISSRFSLSKSPNVVDGVQSRSFRSTSISLLSSRYGETSEVSPEIGPDTILFEGCDFNHWLFVCDFPRDNKPPPEEMIRFYEETCAKGLNIRYWFLIIINSKFNLESLRL